MTDILGIRVFVTKPKGQVVVECAPLRKAMQIELGEISAESSMKGGNGGYKPPTSTYSTLNNS